MDEQVGRWMDRQMCGWQARQMYGVPSLPAALSQSLPSAHGAPLSPLADPGQCPIPTDTAPARPRGGDGAA